MSCLLLWFLSVLSGVSAWSQVLPAGSIQRPSLRLTMSREGRPELPAFMRDEAIRVAELARGERAEVSLELWPTRSDEGQWVWVYAQQEGAWAVRPSELAPAGERRSEPFFPRVTARAGWNLEERARVFGPSADLYELPRFADGVWESATRETLAWPHPSLQAVFLATEGARLSDWTFIELPRPPEAVRFTLRWDGQVARWSPTPEFFAADAAPEAAPSLPAPAGEPSGMALSWPTDFQERYLSGVKELVGESAARFPRSGRQFSFSRKNAADTGHELELLVDYLEERYREEVELHELDLEIERFRFEDLGSHHSNLLVKLKASQSDARKKPLVLVDHFDTAFAEDHFYATGERRSVPGADDNAVATQALIEAARILGPLPRDREIWLLHLTGEEYPSDCLGARHQVAHWLSRQVAVEGVVVLDMIAFVPEGADAHLMQIHPGRSRGSAALAARLAVPGLPLAPRVLGPFNPLSYLYNTDGIIFDDAGYPVVLVNEPMNRWEHFDRPHYHQLTDTTATLNLDYVEQLLKRVFGAVARASVRVL